LRSTDPLEGDRTHIAIFKPSFKICIASNKGFETVSSIVVRNKTTWDPVVSGSLGEEYGGMKARAKVFIHKAAVPTPREVKVPNEQDLIREQDASLATANRRYASKLNEKDSRWGDEDRDKTNALRFEGHTSDEAPTAKQKSYHKGTSAEFNTDDNRTQASRQEERRSKRERKEKRRHKHRRKHSVDEAKKRTKSQDKEGHHRHKRRRHSPASSSATSSSS
jgi:hypothetical protein